MSVVRSPVNLKHFVRLRPRAQTRAVLDLLPSADVVAIVGQITPWPGSASSPSTRAR